MLKHISSRKKSVLPVPHEPPSWRSAVIAGLYLAFFALFFWRIRHGAGQYWDWAFPYFRDQIGAFFSNNSQSWNSYNMGSPLGYSSDFFLRWLISAVRFLQPETLRYVLYVVVFAVGASGTYIFVRRFAGKNIAFVIGLLAWINPAVFYKYTAGHFNYLVAYAVFIYFLYYLFYLYRRSYTSAVVVGLMIAAMGVQIQFFIISALLLALFVAFRPKLFSVRHLGVILGLPVLISLVWLVNFITGANSASQISSAAAKVSFKNSSVSDFLQVFTFNFSNATLLTKYYAGLELVICSLPFIILLILLVRRKETKAPTDVILLVFLVIILFLATGMYQALNLGPLTGIYPMLREVGHFGPLIVFVVLLLIARLITRQHGKWALIGFGVFLVLISGMKFQRFSQRYSFASVRQLFAPFKQVADADKSTYRVLAYPFYDKYAFRTMQMAVQDNFPLTNAGHDSFSPYAKQDFINNQIAPHQFKDSVQNRLNLTYDIDVLRPYNVKYIFDFSKFYQSYYERYVPPSTYDSNLQLIKNDPQFLDKLLAKNPGRLRRVNQHILEITDYLPRAAATADLFSVPSRSDTKDTSHFTRAALKLPFDYTIDEPFLKDKLPAINKIFSATKDYTFDEQNKTFYQEIETKPDVPASVYINTQYQQLYYSVKSGQLAVYARPVGTLRSGDEVLHTEGGQRTVASLPLVSSKRYYIQFRGKTLPLEQKSDQPLGESKPGDTLAILSSAGANQAQNGSFEDGAWQGEVEDCNEYDGSGDVDMRVVTNSKTDGKQALELSSGKHDACTHSDVPVHPNTQYLLSLDYQSDNAQTANFYISYNNQQSETAGAVRGSRAITGSEWRTLTHIITTPDNATTAQLFLYALEGTARTKSANKYDNVSLVPVYQEATVTVPDVPENYVRVPLPRRDKHKLVFEDTARPYDNLVANPSFEHGAWRSKVSDCNAKSSRPAIAMRLSGEHKTDGKQSLELEATRHDACTLTSVNVTEDTDYLLRFDYQGQNARHYGYAVTFDDPNDTSNKQQLELKGSGWQQHRSKVRVPKGASTMTLYFYAFEGDGKTANIVRYDNVRLVELPDFTDRLYVTTSPPPALAAPRQVQLGAQSTTRKVIAIKGATKPFVLMLSETYHPKWRLGLGGQTLGEHFVVNDYMNGWYVDPAELCKKAGKQCKQTGNGTYDFTLVADFTPQRWFVLARTISIITLIGAVGFIIAARLRAKPLPPARTYVIDEGVVE